jgi:hypothetical protein
MPCMWPCRHFLGTAAELLADVNRGGAICKEALLPQSCWPAAARICTASIMQMHKED